MRLERKLNDEGGLILTPLIDMIFLVVIFFMLNTTLSINPAITVELPSAYTSQAVVGREVVVTLTASGALYIGAQAVDFDRFAAELKKEMVRLGTEKMILQADETLVYRDLAGLDSATTGSVVLNGSAFEKLSEDERAAVRSKNVGFIFQNFQLLPTLTALENVMVPLELKKRKDAKEKALSLLQKVGLGDRVTHYPTQLSGGEQQRVSIARAFANEPLILFADEPTGNLDTETGGMIEDLIFNMNKEEGTTLVLVTHDTELAKRTNRIIHIKGGKIQEETNG